MKLRTIVATVTLTAALYTDVRCPTCTRLVLTMPGIVNVEALAHLDAAFATGLGPVCRCKRCNTYVEAVVRG